MPIAEYNHSRKRSRADGKIRCAKCRRWKLSHLFSASTKELVKFQAYCKSCDNKRQESPLRKSQRKRAQTLRQYGITEDQYQELHTRQNGVCAICLTNTITDSRNGRLSIDHDHLTGRVRGLLCGLCNKAVGLLRDDPELARRVIVYLSGGEG